MVGYGPRIYRLCIFVQLALLCGTIAQRASGQEYVTRPFVSTWQADADQPKPSDDATEPIRPEVLKTPLPQLPLTDVQVECQPMLCLPIDPPLGFTGKTGNRPSECQQSSDFVPMEDRWRAGFPAWDRYDKGHPPVDDYPYVEGHWWDPYNQNVLKGDYPIVGQDTFLEITTTTDMLLEARQVPTPAHGFESTGNPFDPNFIGNGSQFFYSQNFKL